MTEMGESARLGKVTRATEGGKSRAHLPALPRLCWRRRLRRELLRAEGSDSALSDFGHGAETS